MELMFVTASSLSVLDDWLVVFSCCPTGSRTKNLLFDKALFLVQIWDLPFRGRKLNMGEKIGCFICHEDESFEKEELQGWFMRVRVKLEISESILHGFMIKVGGSQRLVNFKYEHLQIFCCGIIGHEVRLS